MAWTTPRTWVTGETVTAAIMNTHVRDNFNETAPPQYQAVGDMLYFDGANSLAVLGTGAGDPAILALDTSANEIPVWRVPAAASDTGAATFTNTSYLDLDSVTGGTPLSGDIAVSVTGGTTALVGWQSHLSNTSATTLLTYRVSGATTVAGSDNWAIGIGDSVVHRFGGSRLHTGLTAGSNTFTLQARASGGTGTVDNTYLYVIPF